MKPVFKGQKLIDEDGNVHTVHEVDEHGFSLDVLIKDGRQVVSDHIRPVVYSEYPKEYEPCWAITDIKSDQTEVKEKKGKVIEVGWFGVFVIICAVIGAICIIAMLISPWFPNFISK